MMPAATPGKRQRHRLAHDHRDDGATRGAERRANANLTAALGHRAREQPVEADRGQDQRRCAEHLEQDQRGPALRGSGRDERVERRHANDRLIFID